MLVGPWMTVWKVNGAMGLEVVPRGVPGSTLAEV